MKRTTTFNFLAVILGIGLLVSLAINVYQLYRPNAHWLLDSEASETETNQLLQQLSSCSRENTQKDSVITVLKNRVTPTDLHTLSARTGP
ncbi:hypothetical protein GO730_31370 [Spirosoma sp. HMF3257]|uniref:Uncharacterized protein n=1 Tax=Spirosoma telluris TaxID=2183553 RepID=A0A327NU58_9BACT|nr:hypothetical protein [Spirosoma telluris]RAI77526.1 hypothetical protein HMF3257_31265 [Spirosoma telluris]